MHAESERESMCEMRMLTYDLAVLHGLQLEVATDASLNTHGQMLQHRHGSYRPAQHPQRILPALLTWISVIYNYSNMIIFSLLG